MDRIIELLADQATGPLSLEEQQELETLLSASPHPCDASGRPIHGESISAITGALIHAWEGAKSTTLPAEARSRLLSRGLELTKEYSVPQPQPLPYSAGHSRSATGAARPFSWPLLLTAAAATLALGTSLFMLTSSRQAQTRAEAARLQLEANNQNTLARLASSDQQVAELRDLLNRQRQEANAQLATAAERFETILRDRDDLAQRLQAARQANAETNARLTAATEQVESLQTQLASSERKLSAAEARIALLEQNADTVQVAWTATEDPAAKGVSGDVVWNARLQTGYLRFRGLSANDPAKEQYQAWIFDEGRDPHFPVDAGVFDITMASKDEATGDLVIPIDAKLLIKNPAAFAVTVETPGGVVVTDKKRVVVLAPVPAPDAPPAPK